MRKYEGLLVKYMSWTVDHNGDLIEDEGIEETVDEEQ